MRIDLHNGTSPIAANESSRGQGAASASQTASSGEDQAQLSGTHMQVEALAAQAAQLPEIRQEKVVALREAVEGGRYQVDHRQVADAMLAHLAAAPAA